MISLTSAESETAGTGSAGEGWACKPATTPNRISEQAGLRKRGRRGKGDFMKGEWTEKPPDRRTHKSIPRWERIRNGRSVRAGTDQPTSEGARASGAARRTKCQVDSQSSGCSGAETIKVDSSATPGCTNLKQMKQRQAERSGASTLAISFAGLITPFSKRLHASREQRSFVLQQSSAAEA